MDFWDLTRLVFQRWYVSVPMLLLTIGGAVGTVTSVEPDYIATAHVQLVPPATTLQTPVNTSKTTPTSSPRNPWLDLGLGALSAAGSVTVQDQEVVKQLEAAHLSNNFTVTASNQVPLVTFEAVGNSKLQATQTVDFLTQTFDRNVVALQDSYGAPKTEKISTRRLDLGSNVTESTSKVKRALVAVAGAGVLLTAALTIGLDAFLRRRARKRRDGVDPETPTAAPESPKSDAAKPAGSAPAQRKSSVARASATPARVAVGEESEVDRTVIIRQPARSGANGGHPFNGAAAAGDEPKSANGGKATVTPPGEKTIVLPNVYGSVYGRRGEDKDVQ